MSTLPFDTRDMLNFMVKVHVDAQKWADRIFRGDRMVHMDEIAIVMDVDDFDQFIAEASCFGWRWNASVDDDLMTRRDLDEYFPETWRVGFRFLVHESLPFRIEAMCVHTGYAPLHQYRVGTIIHASFKLRSEGDYDSACAVLLGQHHVKEAEYTNSYGRFSYFNPKMAFGPSIPLVYAKPRVNLRDA